MRLYKYLFLLVLGSTASFFGFAQKDTVTHYKIAVFSPVYLDSSFTGDQYKFGKNNLPKYILPGLEFYNGMQLAIDSLNAENASIEVLFYDSKNSRVSLQELVNQEEFQSVSLIIASFSSRNEINSLADFAFEKNIPLISSTFPNDGGITANPFFVLVNPTINTHIEGIYNYVHKSFPIENILLVKRKGNMEDMIQSILINRNQKTPGIPLKLKTIELTDSFTTKQVTDNLDSIKKNIIICGSLNENFSLQLSKALSSSKKYPTLLIGMPTWDGIKDIGKGLEIIYSSPYNFSKTDKLILQISEKYRTKYAGRPTEMVLKGYESMFHFSKLLMKHGKGLINQLSDKEFTLFNHFDFQPVKVKKENTFPAYLENKKLYFFRKIDGKIKSVT